MSGECGVSPLKYLEYTRLSLNHNIFQIDTQPLACSWLPLPFEKQSSFVWHASKNRIYHFMSGVFCCSLLTYLKFKMFRGMSRVKIRQKTPHVFFLLCPLREGRPALACYKLYFVRNDAWIVLLLSAQIFGMNQLLFAIRLASERPSDQEHGFFLLCPSRKIMAQKYSKSHPIQQMSHFGNLISILYISSDADQNNISISSMFSAFSAFW